MWVNVYSLPGDKDSATVKTRGRVGRHPSTHFHTTLHSLPGKLTRLQWSLWLQGCYSCPSCIWSQDSCPGDLCSASPGDRQVYEPKVICLRLQGAKEKYSHPEKITCSWPGTISAAILGEEKEASRSQVLICLTGVLSSSSSLTSTLSSCSSQVSKETSSSWLLSAYSFSGRRHGT